MDRSRQSQVYRVRQLPLHLEHRGVIARFLARIAPSLGEVDNIDVFSLAQEKPTSKTATISFKTLPSIFDNDQEQWTLQAEVSCGRNIIVDTHFRDFTVLNEPRHCPHTVDCVAISGLASHPFGSWKHRESGSDFMWLRDRLPQDVSQLRSLIYGYDTQLFKSHSFQDIDDIAWSFIASLAEIRRSLPPAKPLVFLAHSLGGIVLKRALVLLACEGNDEQKAILEAVKGLVFFGVPHRGMEISHLLAMVAKQPNEDLISRTLSPHSALLRELEQTPTGTWVRSDTSYAVLVNKESAVPPGTPRRNAIAVNKDHSNMVKFGEDDPVYQIIMSFLSDLSKNKDNQRINHNTSSNMECVADPSSLAPVQNGVRTFSTVPFPKDSGFVGREDIMVQLESEFANPRSQRWASLHGLGGIGKSQIAIEYSYRQRERCPQISTFWIHASSKARFEQSYSEIAMTAEIPGTGDGKVDILQLVSKWLKNRDNGPWLLILDNADDATILLDLSKDDTKPRATTVACRLLDYLPRVQHGAVLITTRDRTCALDLAGHYGTPIEVRSMSSKESVQLLQNTLPDAVEEEASELVEELDKVPLAVSQASAYIKAISQVSIPIYLAKFRRSNEDQAALLNKNKKDLRRDGGVPNAVITSWELSFKQIREKFPSSADLLSLMSYFNRQAIPQMLIQGDDDDVSFYEDINPLISFSLIREEIGENSFEMHRLVQTAMRHWLRSEGYDQLWKERAIERVAHRFPPMKNQAQHWPVCEALMSHADEIILHTASSKEIELNLANVLVFTAWYSVERKGNAVLGEQRSTHALQIQRQYFDDASDEILVTLSALASACVELSKLEKARGLREFVLEQSLKMWGSEDVKTLTDMHNLATSYFELGLYEKAEDLMQRVVKVRENSLGLEERQSLLSESELAEIQLRQGKYEEAEMLISKILEISKRRLGVEHMETLNAMAILSETYMQQNKFEEAENVITQAIPFFTKTFSPNHWRTLDARCLLATIYWRQKKLDEAKEIFLSCFNTAQRVYGPQHRMTLKIINELALIYKDQGKFIDASRLFEDNVEAYNKSFGADHPNTLIHKFNLALCYYDMGDKEDAIQLMTEVLCKRREVLRADHPRIADSARTLARWKSLEEESMREQLAPCSNSSPATPEPGPSRSPRKRRRKN